MSIVKLHSEQFAATGGVDAEGIRNQLGRPEFDPWALVVREAIQNACDARAVNQATVTVAFGWRTLSSAEHRVLAQEVLVEPAPGLSDAWRKRPENTRVLVIADRGTVGLTGPTRADQELKDGKERRFVGLLRNVGQPPQRAVSGGSFGFGKAAFYILSRCQTALIHSRWLRADEQPESRFMVAAVGQSVTHNSKLLTGRHWWGRAAKDGVVEPLLNDEADTFAARLGLPSFSGLDTGTTIAVLDPDPGIWPEAEVGPMLRDAILWNYWPVMLAPQTGQPPPAQFSLAVDGAPATLIEPRTEPLLQPFLTAYRQVAAQLDPARTAVADRGSSTRLHSIKSVRTLIGTLGLTLAPTWRPPTKAVLERLPRLGGPDLAQGLHHVALMRRPRFVVRYEDGPPMLDQELGYGGACVVADNADGAFKRAENQTHNHWVHHHLTDPTEQQWVNSLHAAIRKQTKALVEPAPEAPTSAVAGAALGTFAAALGSLLHSTTRALEVPTSRTQRARVQVTGATSTGDGLPTPPGETPISSEAAGSGVSGVTPTERPVGRPSVRVREATLDVWDGKGVLKVPLVVTRGIRAAGFEVQVTARVMLDHGVEKDAPIGAPVPGVLAWLDADGQVEAGAVEHRSWPEADRWAGTVVIELVDDAAIEPMINAESVVGAVTP